jgi:hypothetical protein
MEGHPAGRVYRAELTRLGLPQPETLRGIDIIEETIRLVGVPLLSRSALCELRANGVSAAVCAPWVSPPPGRNHGGRLAPEGQGPRPGRGFVACVRRARRYPAPRGGN